MHNNLDPYLYAMRDNDRKKYTQFESFSGTSKVVAFIQINMQLMSQKSER